MSTFAIEYEYGPDMETRRAPHRPGHLDLLDRLWQAGSLVLAGAKTDPVDGAWIVVRAESADAARALLADDPYQQAGLVTSVDVRSMALVAPKD